MYGIQKKFVNAVGCSGLRFEEIALISGISEIYLYKFAAGKMDLSQANKARLAAILDKPVDELFPEEE